MKNFRYCSFCLCPVQTVFARSTFVYSFTALTDHGINNAEKRTTNMSACVCVCVCIENRWPALRGYFLYDVKESMSRWKLGEKQKIPTENAISKLLSNAFRIFIGSESPIKCLSFNKIFVVILFYLLEQMNHFKLQQKKKINEKEKEKPNEKNRKQKYFQSFH